MSSIEGFITTKDDVRLFYRKTGNSERMLVIPNGLYLFDDFRRFDDSRTMVFYDVRNRGFSDAINDPSKLVRGIHQDVDDLETVRKYFKSDQIEMIGHSYIGLMIGLYAASYPDQVKRMIQIGPTQPDAGKEYPDHLKNNDGVLAEVFSRITQLKKEKQPEDPAEACKNFWSLLRFIFVANPADAEKIDWGRCELPNERNFMKYWMENILPSIQTVHLTQEDLKNVKSPVLIIHGLKDRSSPYGGAQDWALILPNARLVTVENAAHVPWLEAPSIVYDAIHNFLNNDSN